MVGFFDLNKCVKKRELKAGRLKLKRKFIDIITENFMKVGNKYINLIAAIN